MPGRHIDDAMHVAAMLAGEVGLSMAVLDRPDGSTVFAVSVEATEVNERAAQHHLITELRGVFASVSVLESDPSALATAVGLT